MYSIGEFLQVRLHSWCNGPDSTIEWNLNLALEYHLLLGMIAASNEAHVPAPKDEEEANK